MRLADVSQIPSGPNTEATRIDSGWGLYRWTRARVPDGMSYREMMQYTSELGPYGGGVEATFSRETAGICHLANRNHAVPLCTGPASA